MPNDTILKAMLGTFLTIMYAIVFLTQPLDLATTTALISAFTNALVGIFAYNLHKRKTEQGEE